MSHALVFINSAPPSSIEQHQMVNPIHHRLQALEL
jgi:hypothetical protein